MSPPSAKNGEPKEEKHENKSRLLMNNFMKEIAKEKLRLDIKDLLEEAEAFAKDVSGKSIKELFGKTDGKNVGTYVEKKFKEYLENKYDIETGNSARGIDLPELDVDIKVTSEKKPQSSSPFKNARQQIFGLSHSLLIFVYKKEDDSKKGESKLQINKVYFVDKEKASDKELTKKSILFYQKMMRIK